MKKKLFVALMTLFASHGLTFAQVNSDRVSARTQNGVNNSVFDVNVNDSADVDGFRLGMDLNLDQAIKMFKAMNRQYEIKWDEQRVKNWGVVRYIEANFAYRLPNGGYDQNHKDPNFYWELVLTPDNKLAAFKKRIVYSPGSSSAPSPKDIAESSKKFGDMSRPKMQCGNFWITKRDLPSPDARALTFVDFKYVPDLTVGLNDLVPQQLIDDLNKDFWKNARMTHNSQSVLFPIVNKIFRVNCLPGEVVVSGADMAKIYDGNFDAARISNAENKRAAEEEARRAPRKVF